MCSSFQLKLKRIQEYILKFLRKCNKFFDTSNDKFEVVFLCEEFAPVVCVSLKFFRLLNLFIEIELKINGNGVKPLPCAIN